MGFTKKSLLALVLALVMVLGMAMPTAFAAEPKPTAILFAAAPNANGGAVSGVITALTVEGNGAAQYVAFIGDGSKIFNTAAAGADMKVVATSSNPAVAVEVVNDMAISGGWVATTAGLKLTPKAPITDKVTITVDVTGCDKYLDDWDMPIVFQGKLEVTFKPWLTADKAAIELDKNVAKIPANVALVTMSGYPADKDLDLSGITKYFTPLGGNRVNLANTVATVAASGNYLTITAGSGASAQGTLTISGATVGGVPAQDFSIPLTISDTTYNDVTPTAYKVVPSQDTFDVRMDAMSSIAFTASVVDSKDAPLTTQPPITVSYAADAGVTGTLTAKADVLGNYTVTLTGANAWSGKIILASGSALKGAVNVKISAIEAAGPSQISLDKNLLYSTGYNNTGYKTTVQLTPPSGLSFSNATGDCSVSFSGTNGFSGTYKGNGLFEIIGYSDLTALTAVDTATFSLKSSTGLTIKPLEIPVKMVDTTTKPTITVTPGTSITLDAASSAGKAVDVKVTAAGSISTANPKNVVAVPVAGSVTVTPAGAVQVAAKGSDGYTITADTYVGDCTVEFTPTVDSLPAGLVDKITLKITVKDSTANTPNGIGVSQSSFNMSGSATQFTFDAYLIDSTGARIPGDKLPTYSGGLKFVATTKDVRGEKIAADIIDFVPTTAISSGVRTATVSAPSAQNVGTFVMSRLSDGAAQIEITALDGTTPIPGTSAIVNVTVPAVSIDVNPKTLTLDMKDDTSKKADVVISTTQGTLTLSDLVVKSGNIGNVTVVRNSEGNFTVTGTAVGDLILVASGTVNGLAANTVEIEVTVKNSTGIVANKEKLEFDMKNDASKAMTLTFTAVPSGTPVISSVTSSDSSIVEVSGTGNTRTFTAKKVGVGTITVVGKVGTATVPNLVIPFTVIDSTGAATISVTPAGPIALSLLDGGKSTETLTFASSTGSIDAGSLTITANPAGIVDISTSAPWVITAKTKGQTTLTVNAKVDGVAVAPVSVIVTVDQSVAPVGDFLVNDVAATGTSLYVRNSVANNQYKLTLVGATGAVTWKTSNNSVVKFIDAPASKAAKTKTGVADQYVQVLKAGTVKITATPTGGTAKSISFTIKAEAETGFTVADQALLVGQRASAKPEIVPATAKTKGFKFKSSDKKVVTVSSKGILVAKKAGTATITVTPKKKGLAKQTFTVTVTVDYKNLNYNSVVLLQNSDGKPNADADNVKKIFESARFDASGNAAGANILAATATKADVKAAIATMALASKNTSDISNFYFAGAATKTGLTFTDGEYSYTDLANDLAKCTGNVVVFLDCTGGNRLINAKAASDADIFAAFSKAVKPGLSTMTNSAVEKLSFTVFTSTAKAKTTVTPTVSADGSSVQYKFTKLFAETLKVSDSNTISVGTNGIVNVKQLWAKLKAAKGSVWASKKSVMPIYGYVPAAPVTP